METAGWSGARASPPHRYPARPVPMLLAATDAVLLGRLGGPVLAAGGLAMLLFGLLRSVGVGLVGAVGDAVATVVGVAGGLALLGFGHLLDRTGADAAPGALAATVLAALAPGLVPCLWFEAPRHYRQGMRRPGIPGWLAGVAVAAHLGLAWLLGFGAGPVPGFGAATSVAYLLGFGLLYLRTGSDRALAPMLSLAGGRASLPAVRLLLRRARRGHPGRRSR